MSLQKSLGWMALAQFCLIALQFGAQIVLARLLSPHEFGVFAIAMGLSGVLALVQSLGLQALIVREQELHDEVSTTAFTVNALLAGGLSLLILLASQIGGFFFQEDGVRRVLLALSLTPLTGVIAFLPSAHLERHGRFKEIALAGIVAGALGTLTTVVFALRGASFMSFAYGQWAQAAVFGVMICFLGRAFVSYRVGFEAWRRVMEFGLQMLAVAGIGAVAVRLSDIALGRIISLSALGLYNRAAGLNGVVWTNIHLVVGRVMLVDFAALVRRGESLRDRYIRTVDIITVALWPAFLGLAIIARPFIATVYGEAWVMAATPLAILAAASFVQVAITMTWELFACTGNLGTQTRLEIIRAAIAFAMFLGACFISLEAAALTRLIDAIFAYFLYRPHVNRMTDTKTSDFLPLYARNVALAVLAVAPAFGVVAMHGFSTTTPMLLVGASIGVGILLWACALAWTRHPLMQEANRLMRSKLGAT